MILAILLLATGLIISAVAIYYSVIGLAAIFAAAAIPIYIMGGSLEVAKLVCASWLKANWDRVPAFMKYYMITAVVVLMFITSMGIFGFLSKAHTDQNLVSGDVISKIAIYDEKIKTARENIDANRKALRQLDEAVDQVMARSSSEQGADKAVALRRTQARERTRLFSEIDAEQQKISKLNEARAPIAAEVRKVEAEVGPIKYIAKFIYGDNPDQNLLEKAVTWVIILLVIVFDPLAVIMLLAAQMTFGWLRDEKLQTARNSTVESPGVVTSGIEEEKKPIENESLPIPTSIEISSKDLPIGPTPHHLDTHPYLNQGFKYPQGWEFMSPMAGAPDKKDQDEDSTAYVAQSNTEEATKESPKAVNDAVEQALAWAEEQTTKASEVPIDFPESQESKKKTKYIMKERDHQIKKTKE